MICVQNAFESVTRHFRALFAVEIEQCGLRDEVRLIFVADEGISHQKGKSPANAGHRPPLYRISSRNSPEAGAVQAAISKFSLQRPSTSCRNSSVVISRFPTLTSVPTIRRTMRHRKCDPEIRNWIMSSLASTAAPSISTIVDSPGRDGSEARKQTKS